jgi:elongation factor 1-gamma
LNAHLLTRTYLVGERISLADIVVGASLSNLYKSVLDPNFRKPFPNLNRWFVTVVNQPNFVKVLGEVQLATVQAVAPDAPAQPAAPAKKEAAKPAPAKKEVAKEEEDAPAPAPVSILPLHNLS